MDLTSFAEEVGPDDPVTISGADTRGGRVPDARHVRAPSGVEWIQPDEMTVCCGAGTPVDELQAALAEHGQRTVLPDGGTVGGALAAGRSGVRRLGDGPVRDALLQTVYVGADGAIVKAGGPTVKNVSGFDVCRLLVGSQGTLGFLGEALLRTRPLARASCWFRRAADEPMAIFAAVHRPVCMLWDGAEVHVLLEGHPRDVADIAAAAALRPSDAPPALPSGRTVLRPSQLADLATSLPTGSFVAELGIGVVHHDPAVTLPAGAPAPDPGLAAIGRRIKTNFDPTGRLNPGRIV